MTPVRTTGFGTDLYPTEHRSTHPLWLLHLNQRPRQLPTLSSHVESPQRSHGGRLVRHSAQHSLLPHPIPIPALRRDPSLDRPRGSGILLFYGSLHPDGGAGQGGEGAPHAQRVRLLQSPVKELPSIEKSASAMAQRSRRPV